ncbi:MAG: Hsp20/alpha crystallin family protein [Myxococcaceae bacterium]
MNIFKKESVPAPLPTWDPFQEMRALLGLEPFRNLRGPLNNNDVGAFVPAFEVKETKEGYLFKGDLPGVKENDFEVNLMEDRLIIQGKREAERTEQNETLYTWERSYGSFMRTFTLPRGIDRDHVKAELKDGVLTVMVPRAPEAQAKKIAVKAEKTKA